MCDVVFRNEVTVSKGNSYYLIIDIYNQMYNI